MLRRLRTLSAVLCAVTLVAASVPAAASQNEATAGADNAPPIIDALILRPLGFVALGVGLVTFIAPVGPITLITRPSEIDEPFETLVASPARYIWADPLGSH